jgi:hypothetical protein
MRHPFRPFALAAVFVLFGMYVGLSDIPRGALVQTLILLACGFMAGATVVQGLAARRRVA